MGISEKLAEHTKSIDLRIVMNPTFESIQERDYFPIGIPLLVQDINKYTPMGLLNELSTILTEEELFNVDKIVCWYIHPQQAYVKDENVGYMVVIGLKKLNSK